MSEATTALAHLVAYLDELLEAQSGEDFCPNGLQVEGRAEVGRLVTGVSACRELFRRAADSAADAILVHHGIFWKGQPPTLTGVQYRRVAELIRADLSLLAYHLPLDRHPELGNNALAARGLGLLEPQPFAEFAGLPIGFHGRLPEAVRPDQLVVRCRELFEQDPLVFLEGPERISAVGVVSGAGERALYEAVDLNLDAFVTGEASEWVMHLARDAGIHFLAAGHYATERLGVRALGEHLTAHFGLEVEFVDLPNPV